MFKKEEALFHISILVERFHEQIGSYKKSEYNETLARQVFINQFFKGLVGDEDKINGNAKEYREVINEEK